MQYAGYPQAAAPLCREWRQCRIFLLEKHGKYGTLEKNQDYGILRPFAQNRKGEEA